MNENPDSKSPDGKSTKTILELVAAMERARNGTKNAHAHEDARTRTLKGQAVGRIVRGINDLVMRELAQNGGALDTTEAFHALAATLGFAIRANRRNDHAFYGLQAAVSLCGVVIDIATQE